MLPQGDGTHVTWVMYGPANFMSRLIQVFVNLDNLVGQDFEAGLARLKALTGNERHYDLVPDAVQRPWRCAAEPGPTMDPA